MRIDSITVDNEEEASRLLIHHLHIAAMLFEATYDDNGAFVKALIRRVPPIEQPAMEAFVNNLLSAYEAFNER